MSKTILRNEITAGGNPVFKKVRFGRFVTKDNLSFPESSRKKRFVLTTIQYELETETHCWNLNFCCRIESFIHHLPTEELKRKPVPMTCPNCLSYIRTQLKYLKLHPRKKFRKLAHCLAPMFSCIICNRFRKIIHLCPFCGIALGVSNVFNCF